MNAIKVNFKKWMYILSLSILIFAIVGCSNANDTPTTETQTTTETQLTDETQSTDEMTSSVAEITESTEPEALVLTLEELAQYDGKNGNPAYVAVDGIIYDVTPIKAWQNGQHNGYEAGKDLTDIIKGKSPHGLSVLEKLVAVGKLAE